MTQNSNGGRAGGGRPPPPLFMGHAGPGSSLGLSPIPAKLGRDRLVVASNMMRNGDSDPPHELDMGIVDYVDNAVDTLATRETKAQAWRAFLGR